MAGVEGDESYGRLIVNIYGARNGNVTQDYKEYNVKIRPDEIVMQSLNSFVRSGNYEATIGKLNLRISYGRLWDKKTGSSAHAYDFVFFSGYLLPRNIDTKGHGSSLRCVAKSQKSAS